MLSQKFFAQISALMCSAKSLTGLPGLNLPFDRVNVILIGDFHQLPPVTGHLLYWPIDHQKDEGEEHLGHSLYEQFKTVV